jgi:hypothetical protein
MEWGVGILPDDPEEPVLHRILCANPGSDLSTAFTGPCPTVSDDGYVKVELEVFERPVLGGFGFAGKFSLTIRCGDQGMSPTNATDQNSVECGE